MGMESRDEKQEMTQDTGPITIGRRTQDQMNLPEFG